MSIPPPLPSPVRSSVRPLETADSIPQGRDPADVERGVAALEAVGVRLRRQGWAAQLVVLRLCGDEDVRLWVPGTPGSVEVELLCPGAAAPRATSWHAVRTTPQRRIVWCGPSLACSADELVRFLTALAQPDATGLAERYQPLS